MASSTDSLVVMPDFFKGETLDPSVYPPKNDEDKKKLSTFFSTVANPKDRLVDANAVVEALREDGRTKLGVMGYCWGKRGSGCMIMKSNAHAFCAARLGSLSGGKMATLSGATGSFEAVASIHPGTIPPVFRQEKPFLTHMYTPLHISAMVSADDAKDLKAPIALFISQNEDEEEVRETHPPNVP